MYRAMSEARKSTVSLMSSEASMPAGSRLPMSWPPKTDSNQAFMAGLLIIAVSTPQGAQCTVELAVASAGSRRSLP
jgi:hypothetical protein